MKHEKTFDAIGKLKDIELELHRLKNALEMANKGLDAQRQWVGLTVTTILNMMPSAIPAEYDGELMEFARAVETKLKEKNNG